MPAQLPQLASRTETQHDRLLSRAERTANAVDRSIVQAWNRLLARIGSNPSPVAALATSRHLTRQMFGDIFAALSQSFGDLARRGYRTAADTLTATVPTPHLQASLLHKRHLRAKPRLIEAKQPPFGVFLHRVPMRDNFDDLPEEEQRDHFAELLFPPPSLSTITKWLGVKVNGMTWIDSIAQSTSLSNATPDALAGFIAGGFAAGQTLQQIAKTLEPLVQGVQTTARRVARTYGMAIAHEAAFNAHEQLGDMVIGYEIHAQRDQNTRAWHAERDGTIYYKDPKPGQKGLFQMPRPPLEAQDITERPAGTPQTAYS